MEGFEDLGLSPELVEALAGEGIERPTPLQEAALPVIRQGNNLVARAGPGAGTLVAWGAALLDRLEPRGEGPRAVVLAPGPEDAEATASSLARLAAATGHGVAAVDGPWVLPQRADVLVGTPGQVLAWTREGRVGLDALEAVVIAGASGIQEAGGLDALETILEFCPSEAQRVVVSLPLTPEIEDLASRLVKRAVHVPPRAATGEREDVPRRGDVRYRIVPEPREAAVPGVASELLGDGEIRHLCLFFRSDDRAADVGDQLVLHGFGSGAPGDPDQPVWLAVDELEARRAMDEADAEVIPVSVDAPAGPDALDRRHGAGRGGVVVVLAREMAHLRDVARRTGYGVVPFPPPPPARPRGELQDLLAALDEAAASGRHDTYLALLAPLFERHGAEEVAAAAVALARERLAEGAAARAGAAPAVVPGGPRPRTPAGGTTSPPAWVRLYVSLGSKDRAGPGDILGAITGESGIDGSRVGKIEIRDSFSLVEVEDAVADRVIRGLNGTTVKGRSVRVDYDRGSRERGRTGKGEGRPSGRRRPRGEGPRGRSG